MWLSEMVVGLAYLTSTVELSSTSSTHPPSTSAQLFFENNLCRPASSTLRLSIATAHIVINMAIEIRPITASDIPSAVECIQQAFEDDPYYLWAFDAAKFNKERNFASLKAKCEWGMRNALFFVAKDPSDKEDRVLGVSMWMKPRPVDQPQTWAEWLDDYMLWFKQGLNLLWYQGRGGLRTERYWIWKREQAAAQAELWTDPHGYYFCNIVVVKPGTQGKGIGRLLFQTVTNMADQEGRKCYLESSKEKPNIAIYEKMGFRLVRKMVCEEGGDVCDLFCMARDPQPVS
jgi:arrestin-related trafficking adapter 3/6